MAVIGMILILLFELWMILLFGFIFIAFVVGPAKVRQERDVIQDILKEDSM